MAHDHLAHVWELVEKIGTCMLVTWDGQSQRARPMSASVKPDEYMIYFLADARREKMEQIEEYPKVLLTFADTGGQKYVSVSGRAVVSNDREKIKDLWSPFAKAWWDSADDPNIRVIAVSPDAAELWDSPGTLIATVKMLTAAATGARPDMGENRKVTM
ncbi:MAG: pyridoxamine 5'-phosphate oxidase family protein [Alphaproteobacteria bacterium]|nr:pyridoxamine 5'-phosphate oxidase family protein [Alphaproteobacteria bacterium]MBV9418252.1 pyridoxamine 5'-phosphate oxidase family protein [Alphaproteobacteria bacterium]